MERRLTRKDMFNAKNGISFKEASEKNVSGLMTAFGTKTDSKNVDKETGEIREKTICIIVIDGQFYTGESATVKGDLIELDEFITDEELEVGVPVRIIGSKSKSGRTFCNIALD